MTARTAPRTYQTLLPQTWTFVALRAKTNPSDQADGPLAVSLSSVVAGLKSRERGSYCFERKASGEGRTKRPLAGEAQGAVKTGECNVNPTLSLMVQE